MKLHLRKPIESLAQEYKEAILKPVHRQTPLRFDKVVSTGSTLLDLAISGSRVRGGGLCGGIIVEISGPPSTGKTALLAEILSSVQLKGGDFAIKDPEARLAEEYAEIYGVHIDKANYEKPDTVTEVFESMKRWNPSPKVEGAICAMGIDSLAALSTVTEMKEGDKRGQLRAKEFSAGLRVACRKIEKENWLIVCTNQEREGDFGPVTPGGKGIPYYASLRIRISQAYPSWKIERKEEYKKKEIKNQIGVVSTCKVIKSSLDRPFRTADVWILWNYGIGDIMGNLQYYKDTNNLNRYLAVDKEFQGIDKAVKYVEDRNYEARLRDMVIDTWEEVQAKFDIERKPKVRF